MEDLNLAINSPAALKHLSASTKDGERVFTQIFSFFSTLDSDFMWSAYETVHGCAMHTHTSAVFMLFAHACIPRRVLKSSCCKFQVNDIVWLFEIRQKIV